MSRMDYDKLAASAPLNRTAAMVVSAKGEHWRPKPEMAGLSSDAPSMVPVAPGSTDHTGIQMGRLRVVGRAAKKGADGKARWVCRCACGNYMTMRSKAIQLRAIDRCMECDYLDQMRAGTMKGMARDKGPLSQNERRQARGLA